MIKFNGLSRAVDMELHVIQNEPCSLYVGIIKT